MCLLVQLSPWNSREKHHPVTQSTTSSGAFPLVSHALRISAAFDSAARQLPVCLSMMICVTAGWLQIKISHQKGRECSEWTLWNLRGCQENSVAVVFRKQSGYVFRGLGCWSGIHSAPQEAYAVFQFTFSAARQWQVPAEWVGAVGSLWAACSSATRQVHLPRLTVERETNQLRTGKLGRIKIKCRHVVSKGILRIVW